MLAWIYPNRVAIGLVGAVAFALLALVAWRRGWFGAARRHPARSAIAVAVALAIGLPLTWYLASPLVIRTTLAESAPTPAGSPPAAVPSAASAPAASPSAGPGADRTGMFVGADDFHFAMGTARIIETSPGQVTLRFEDFSVRNGPDLYVYLSPDPSGYVDGAFELGTLKATDGAFNYEIPPTVDIAAIRSIVIWCKAFSVEFGSAELSV